MGVGQELAKLAELKAAGAISADEFKAAKRSLLSDSSAHESSPRDGSSAGSDDDVQHPSAESKSSPEAVAASSSVGERNGAAPSSGEAGVSSPSTPLRSADAGQRAELWSVISGLIRENRLKQISREDFETLLDSDPHLATLLERPPEQVTTVANKLAKDGPVGLEGIVSRLTELDERDSTIGVWVLLSAPVALVIGVITAFLFVAQAPEGMSSELANGWASFLAVAVGTLAALALVGFGAQRLEYTWRQASLVLLLPLAGCLASGSLWLGNMSDAARLPWEDSVELAGEAANGDDAAVSETEPDPEPVLGVAEVEAIEACEEMAVQVANDQVQVHRNQFLERNADSVNPAQLLTAMRAECSQTISAYESAYREEFNRSQEEALGDPEDDGSWWQQLPQPLGGCFRDYNDATYLSVEAQAASVCIVDELAFGGTTPTDDAVRNLTGEILFHATWATWEDATRRVQCQPIKERGFDAAEELGIVTIRTWNQQLAAAGATKEFDDYAIVLDFLDVCETY